MTTGGAVLGARNVTKAFFGNPVLRGVSIELLPGRIHALLGENGAGKSTLINLLSGTLAPDSGTILVDGQAVAALAPREARRLGIAVVQQELSLAAHLSKAEAPKAVRLWGAAGALREALGSPMLVDEQERYEQQIALTRSALGADAFAIAWEAGHALSMEQATDYALSIS